MKFNNNIKDDTVLSDEEKNELYRQIDLCAGFNNILRALRTSVIEDETKSHDIYDKDYRHKVLIIDDTNLVSYTQIYEK